METYRLPGVGQKNLIKSGFAWYKWKTSQTKETSRFTWFPTIHLSHLPHQQYARLFLHLVSKLLTFWPVLQSKSCHRPQIAHSQVVFKSNYWHTLSSLSKPKSSTFWAQIQFLILWLKSGTKSHHWFYFKTWNIISRNAHYVHVNMRTIEILHCAHILKIKCFVPDTPSFCDHVWSHLELF